MERPDETSRVLSRWLVPLPWIKAESEVVFVANWRIINRAYQRIFIVLNSGPKITQSPLDEKLALSPGAQADCCGWNAADLRGARIITGPFERSAVQIGAGPSQGGDGQNFALPPNTHIFTLLADHLHA